jgi:hypothetical protein
VLIWLAVVVGCFNICIGFYILKIVALPFNCVLSGLENLWNHVVPFP